MCALLIAALIALAASTSGQEPEVRQPDPPKPEFTFSDFSVKGDTITATLVKDRVVFTVVSTNGIGGGTINLKAGDWPKEIVILLTYSGDRGFANLEHFLLKTARIRASGSLGASGKVPFSFLDRNGEIEPLESGWEGGTLDLKVVKTARGIELRLPPRMLVGSKSLEANWIDAFRR
jgi:hypothetical protein